MRAVCFVVCLFGPMYSFIVFIALNALAMALALRVGALVPSLAFAISIIVPLQSSTAPNV